jgi:preprotein translocase subunit SecY
MPLIFASSLLGLPLALARLTDSATLERAAAALGPGGALYLPVNVALIAFFNYYYTFLQVGRKTQWGQPAAAGAIDADRHVHSSLAITQQLHWCC